MRFLYMLISCFSFAVSIVCFALGWHWDLKGAHLQVDYPNDWELKILGHALSDLGNTLECLGGMGGMPRR